ncbi:MAG TPA: MFS transporter [Burkholderiales bacterium]|nr:MFS transporter [Burkholderiales bacterium]
MIRLLLAARALRAFADGFIAVVLPAYLLALGLGQLEVGFISTATLFGSALATLAVGRWGHRFSIRRLLVVASLAMAATGLAFAGFSSLWPLLVVAFVGTLNPSSGDASVFLPLDHTMIASAAPAHARTTVFARYSFVGSIFGAAGALAAAVPEWLASQLTILEALRLMFLLYAAIAVLVWLVYLRLPDPHAEVQKPSTALGPSRGIVWRLAALFSVDSFAGGLILNSLLALWLFQRFGMSLAAAGAFFFWTGLLAATSQLVAPILARRIGLINTMVFTHIPSSVCLIGAALAPGLEWALGLLLARAALSQMDVPARSAFVMSVVTPVERPAAASFTAVPRSLASALGPSLTGVMFAAGAMAAPLVLCGVLKISYDLALFAAFRRAERESAA